MSILKVNTLQNTSGNPDIANVGKVLQVTYAQNKSAGSVSGNGWNLFPNLTGSITTASASNKVLVRVSLGLALKDDYYTVTGRLYRGGSHLTGASASDDGNREGCFFSVGLQQWNNYGKQQVCQEYLDSPGSAATHQYQIYVRDPRDSQTIYVNRGSYDSNNANSPIGTSSITLMEVV